MSGSPRSAWQPCIRYWPIAASGPPVADPLRHLRRERVRRVAEEQQIRRLDHAGPPDPAAQPSVSRRVFHRVFAGNGPSHGAPLIRPDRHMPLLGRSERGRHGTSARRRLAKGALATTSRDGEFRRKDSVCRDWITADGSPGPNGGRGFPAESGRYHLYVSYACPWAHRTLIFRALKGLDAAYLASTSCTRSSATTAGRFDTGLPRRHRRPARRPALPARGLPRRTTRHHQPGHGAGALGQGDRHASSPTSRPRSSGC